MHGHVNVKLAMGSFEYRSHFYGSTKCEEFIDCRPCSEELCLHSLLHLHIVVHSYAQTKLNVYRWLSQHTLQTINFHPPLAVDQNTLHVVSRSSEIYLSFARRPYVGV
jgi:hypothetical protein